MTKTGGAPVRVRRANPDDTSSFLALRSEWQRQEPTPEFVQAFTTWFEQEWASRWWWLALDDPLPVGMVNLKLFDRMPSTQGVTSRWGYLCNLYVSPARRRSGVGGSLVADLLVAAREQALVRVVLSPSEESVPLYRRCGFTDAHGLLAWHPGVTAREGARRR